MIIIIEKEIEQIEFKIKQIQTFIEENINNLTFDEIIKLKSKVDQEEIILNVFKDLKKVYE